MSDTLSIYDPRDSTAARPDTREEAAKACKEHRPSLSEGSLAGLRVGIPQVCHTLSLLPQLR